ncbi:hypothetical protein G6F57_001758 [Rhizopus arrhizus]|uniref:SPX domain-containing protein n=1 Tax=Rhizopus oryzae TaxID=64495 RepID=A0A9P6XHU1_RHIOR|nr:hypothetical protein G6F23_000268 [Rhizopus arrhizus]KAG1427888.1 hypothetical protein G6F58_000820 [Rhizopus delemar]KAG0769054.1 hypothetical protein G6F24_001405 [Rhizopus arrhizus]KAG0795837.1 hypothetical protein G6F21_001790 [Rhizopus arrhizus]KAG0802501.1 hypothetical protein G6F22_000195 [Rhizopus arrhizus]
MKFSSELNSRIKEPWRDSYIQYAKLNIYLKSKLENRWTDKHEYEFISLIEHELKKVYRFVQMGIEQLNRRIDHCDILLEKKSVSFDYIADMLAEILVDTDELAKFHELNLVGFQKIIKKHDEHTSHSLHTFFFEKTMESFPLDKQRFDVLIVKISKMHDICRRQGIPWYANDPSACNEGADQTAFERATSKYWVHPDHITEVKAIILLHLPIHIFNQKKPYEASDAAVSSIYYDNNSLDNYHARLNRNKGAETIRIRWYGKSDQTNNDVYIERKTHRAEWLDDKSVKDRFKLKESQVIRFMSGLYTAENFKEDLESKEKMTSTIIKNSYFVAKGIQKSTLSRNLKPICRIFYNRTAFQFPGDQKLRISLDCNLTFIREDHLDGQTRRAKDNNGNINWRRSYIGIDYPFRKVNEDDIIRFPYAILEIKIQSHLGQQTPDWLSALLNSHLVHEVPNFSKYVHGIGFLLKNYVSDSPPWVDELKYDIRKTATPSVGLSRSRSSKALFNGHHRRSLMSANEESEDVVKREPAERFREMVNLTSLNWTFDNTKFIEKLGDPVLDNEILRQENSISLLASDAPDRIQVNEGSESTDKHNVVTKTFSGYKDKRGGQKEMAQEPLSVTPSALERGFKKPSRKGTLRKLDPKAFFSNERTFMSWLQFCAILLTIALNLLNDGDGISRFIGALFIIVSSLVCMYALARFHLRAFQLRTGRLSIRIDDIYGPGVLCALLVTALAINFYLRAPLLFSPDRNKVLPNPVGHS